MRFNGFSDFNHCFCATRSRIKDCGSIRPLSVWGVSIVACVPGNGRVWSSQDNVERMEPWSVQSARETDAMEKLMLNHRKDRDDWQVKTGWYTWAKMAWNSAISLSLRDGKRTKWFPVYRLLLKRQKISLMRNLVNPICSFRRGKNPAKGINGIEGRGCFKKRMLDCNG